jgi:hypothetical protein
MLAGNAAQHNKVKKNLCFLRKKISHKNLQMKVKIFDLSKMVTKLKYKWNECRKIGRSKA